MLPNNTQNIKLSVNVYFPNNFLRRQEFRFQKNIAEPTSRFSAVRFRHSDESLLQAGDRAYRIAHKSEQPAAPRTAGREKGDSPRFRKSGVAACNEREGERGVPG